MPVVFDAEALLAFGFDEPGAAVVEEYLERVYDGETDGVVTTVDLAETHYVAGRRRTPEDADAYVEELAGMGLTEYGVDGLWRRVAEIKRRYNPSLADAYALAAAKHEDDGGRDVTLLVGADDDYDAIEDDEYGHLVERFRDEAV